MDFFSLHMIDIAALFFVFLSILFGFFRGFIREILALVAWLAAGILTATLYPYTSTWIAENIHQNSAIVAGLAAVGVFLVFLFIFMLFGRPLWYLARRSSFWLIDSVLGLFYGLIRGALVLCILFVASAYLTTSTQRNEWTQGSRFLPYINDGTHQALSAIRKLPHDLVRQDWFGDMLTDLEKRLGPRMLQNPRFPATGAPVTRDPFTRTGDNAGTDIPA